MLSRYADTSQKRKNITPLSIEISFLNGDFYYEWGNVHNFIMYYATNANADLALWNIWARELVYIFHIFYILLAFQRYRCPWEK